MQIAGLNRKAVEVLLLDADRALALTQVENTGGREIEQDMIANAQKNYADPERRSRPLIMSDGDQIAFQRKLDRLRACLRFFGISV